MLEQLPNHPDYMNGYTRAYLNNRLKGLEIPDWSKSKEVIVIKRIASAGMISGMSAGSGMLAAQVTGMEACKAHFIASSAMLIGAFVLRNESKLFSKCTSSSGLILGGAIGVFGLAGRVMYTNKISVDGGIVALGLVATLFGNSVQKSFGLSWMIAFAAAKIFYK